MKRKGLLSLALAATMSAAASAEVHSKPWLGVMLSPVGGATAHQLALAPDAGIMVTNVAAESPAADAGIEQYDVIIELNGEPVSTDFAAFSEQIAAIGVGEQANMTVLRGGQRVNVVAALGEMPPPEEITYLHEAEPNIVTQFDRNVFGKILDHDDQGNWVMRDLGELEELDDLFGNGRVGIFSAPGAHGQMTFKFDGTESQTRQMKVIRDGKMLEIALDESGQITVRRGSEDDPATVTEQIYDSEEALQKADDEAYELYKQLDSGTGLFSVVTPDGKMHVELRQQIVDAMEQAHKAMQDAQALTDDATAQLHDQLRTFQIRTPNAWQAWPNLHGIDAFGGKPRTSFQLEADGSIVVTTRDGENVLTRTYESTADLEARDPKLYAKFQALHDAE